MCSGSSRRASSAACRRGCRVLTRPPRISSWPVNSETSVTSSPASRSADAVPPVERISTPRPARPRAKSAIPVLSETETSARRTLIAPSSTVSDRVSAAASVIDHDPARVVGVDPNPARRDHADRLRVELVLGGVNCQLECRAVAIGGNLDLALQDYWSGIDPLVDEVDADAGDVGARVERLANRIESGEGGQQGGVDVDDAVAEARDEAGAEQLHVAGEDDQVSVALLDPLGHRRVTLATIAEVLAREESNRNPRRSGPFDRRRSALVRADPNDLDSLAHMDAIQDRLQS